MTYPVIKETVHEHMKAIEAMGCDPAWDFFRDSFGWYRIRSKLTTRQQDLFQEIWQQIYRNKKGVLRKTCR